MFHFLLNASYKLAVRKSLYQFNFGKVCKSLSGFYHILKIILQSSFCKLFRRDTISFYALSVGNMKIKLRGRFLKNEWNVGPGCLCYCVLQ